MKVVLQQDVKDLGKVGDLCTVSSGYARNFLFPRKLAVEATEGKVKEFQHLQKVAEIKKQKMLSVRKELLEKLASTDITFKMDAGENSDKLFGSITNFDISQKLEEMGLSVDRRDILLEEPIKILGQHKATVKLGEGLQGDLTVNVERNA